MTEDTTQRNDLALFSWGYEGWGNATAKLVEIVDAVEAARGRGRPVFVDVRASRRVRAEGFRERAFEKLLGPDRYRWMQGLGNQSVVDGGLQGRLVDKGQAADLLRLTTELRNQNRRAIFFCSCASPSALCHRNWVADAVLEVARRASVSLTVIEWPGFESKPDAVLHIEASDAVIDAFEPTRKSLPLGRKAPSVALAALPWCSPVELCSDEQTLLVAAGPAQYRAGAWRLPLIGGVDPRSRGDIARKREELAVLPRTVTGRC